MLRRLIPLCLFAGLMASGSPLPGLVVRHGASLEVRLSTPIGSHFSREGDRVEAVVIAPVLSDHSVVHLQGATLLGTVERALAVGWGLKRRNAELTVRFDKIRLPDGAEFPIEGRVRDIETAREHVAASGTIIGIDPAASVSTALSLLIGTVLIDSELEAPAVLVKVLAARSPDYEISLPKGSELFVELTNDFALDAPHAGPALTPALSSDELTAVSMLLRDLPAQHTEVSRHHSSDLMNVLLLGTKQEVDTAFRRAGWSGESRRSPLALYRLFHSLTQRMGYSMAPMSRLMFNGAQANITYQKSLNTIAKRHHVRFWKQQMPNAWLGAASEDVSLAIRRMHLTHAVDGEIDNERAKVINDLWFTGCVDQASLLPREGFATVARDRFSVSTDGALAVLRLGHCDPPPQVAFSTTVRTRFVLASHALGSELVRANPLTVAFTTARSVSTLVRRDPPSPLLSNPELKRASVVDSRSDQFALR